MIRYLTEVDGAIWRALESNSSWVTIVKPACRIKYNYGKGNPIKPDNMGVNDFPQAELFPGNFSTFMFSAPSDETFETYAPEFDPITTDQLMTHTQDFVLTLTSKELKLGEFDPLVNESMRGLILAGPRLGLSFVDRVGGDRGIIGTVKRLGVGDNKTSFRFETQLVIPVEMKIPIRDF